MHRLTADSWLDLATARARELECDSAEQLTVNCSDLEVTDCQTSKRVRLSEVLNGKRSVVVFLRHFA
jgi:hypothetical protein